MALLDHQSPHKYPYTFLEARRQTHSSKMLLAIAVFAALVNAACHHHNTPWTRRLPTRKDIIPLERLAQIEAKVAGAAFEEDFKGISFSVSITNLNETIWSYHQTAPDIDPSYHGADPVTGDTFYRVASITKMFTTTAILQLYADGLLGLDDTVSKFLSDLRGHIHWHQITVKSLVSQVSGIPRDWSQGDMTSLIPNHTLKGFPTPNFKLLPNCYENIDFKRSCNATELIETLSKHKPVFAPNQVTSYSNAGFELLGLIVENVTGTNYIDYVNEHILSSYGMSEGATFKTPPERVSAIVDKSGWFWDVDLGVHIPAGGLYATSNGLDQYMRVLMNKAEAHELGAPRENIFAPGPYSFGASSAYGLTWEMFRSSSMLSNGRTVTFYTKGGGMPGYITMILALPEYGLGITILCSGELAGGAQAKLRDIISVELVRAAEEAADKEITRKYAGRFDFSHFLGTEEVKHLNSSLTLAQDSIKGLYIDSWISNGTDMVRQINELYQAHGIESFTQVLVSTGLQASDSRGHRGEIWRGAVYWPSRGGPWDDFCVNDVDGLHYDGRPFLEFVFYLDGEVVEIPSLEVRLKRSSHRPLTTDHAGLHVQKW